MSFKKGKIPCDFMKTVIKPLCKERDKGECGI